MSSGQDNPSIAPPSGDHGPALGGPVDSASARQSVPPGGTETGFGLAGDLPCICCGYNLKGVSVKGMCPECGTRVRATVLSRVDPDASELTPLWAPRLTAFGLVLWATASVAACAAAWVRCGGVFYRHEVTARAASDAFGFALGVSAFGALALVRPHGKVPIQQSAAAVGALCCFGVLLAAHFQLVRIDAAVGWPYAGLPEPTRTGWHAVFGLALLGAIMGLRVNARELAARSVLFRTGRYDRQTMLAAAAAVLAGLLGDASHAVSRVGLTGPATWSGAEPALVTLGTGLIACSSVFVTVAIGGIAVDSFRIADVIRRTPISVEQLFGLRPRDGAP